MRQILVLLALVITSWASPISVGPIPMTGSGVYTWNYGGGSSLEFSASGSNGSDSSSMFINTGFDEGGSPIPPVILSPIDDCFPGSVTVDGITGITGYGCRFGSENTEGWSLGDGGGSITVGDPSGDPLATASLIAYVSYTNEAQTFSDGTLQTVTAFFDILPTPEPGAASLCLVGLAILALRVKTGRLRPRGKGTH